MRLDAFGISTDLPPGWEGRIARRTAPVGERGPEARPTPTGTPGEAPQPVAHLANFPLPEARGDFGSGAVDLMGSGHLFICLFEFGPEAVGTALFAERGIPRLTPAMFDPNALQRAIRGQAGAQRWFTEANRAFCLYVVLGAHGEATQLTSRANEVLGSTRISPR